MAELVTALAKANREGSLEAMFKDPAKAEPLVVDALGYVLLDPSALEALGWDAHYGIGGGVSAALAAFAGAAEGQTRSFTCSKS